MSYYSFPKLEDHTQADLVSNTRKSLSAKDFFNRDCSWNSTTKVNGICAYGVECWKCCIVKKVKCIFFDDLYIGNTKNTLKNETTLPTYIPKGTVG